MVALSQSQIPRLLLEWSNGSNEAVDSPLPLVDQEVKRRVRYDSPSGTPPRLTGKPLTRKTSGNWNLTYRRRFVRQLAL
jgi:hypothetical protein